RTVGIVAHPDDLLDEGEYQRLRNTWVCCMQRAVSGLRG
ncbi:hypothetical protein A2U01_0098097, partial [Trifolium medium]|nr:hypothetical protein [Trifolium medium]